MHAARHAAWSLARDKALVGFLARFVLKTGFDHIVTVLFQAFFDFLAIGWTIARTVARTVARTIIRAIFRRAPRGACTLTQGVECSECPDRSVVKTRVGAILIVTLFDAVEDLVAAIAIFAVFPLCAADLFNTLQVLAVRRLRVTVLRAAFVFVLIEIADTVTAFARLFGVAVLLATGKCFAILTDTVATFRTFFRFRFLFGAIVLVASRKVVKRSVVPGLLPTLIDAGLAITLTLALQVFIASSI